MVVPKFRGTFLGVPIIRTIVYWGLYWDTLILGNYYINALWGFKVSGFLGDRGFGGLGFRVVFGFRALGFFTVLGV